MSRLEMGSAAFRPQMTEGLCCLLRRHCAINLLFLSYLFSIFLSLFLLSPLLSSFCYFLSFSLFFFLSSLLSVSFALAFILSVCSLFLSFFLSFFLSLFPSFFTYLFLFPLPSVEWEMSDAWINNCNQGLSDCSGQKKNNDGSFCLKLKPPQVCLGFLNLCCKGNLLK